MNHFSAQLNSGFNIPVRPEVVFDLQKILQSAEPNILDIAELISHDVGLSAHVLKIINSSRYGTKRLVSDIKQSVMLLGIDFIKQLIQNHNTSNVKANKFSCHRFWDSSMQIAFLSNILIEYLDIKSDIPFEDAYTAGLFLDCGIPVMLQRYDNYLHTLSKANNVSGIILTEIEEQEYQSNHAVIGYFFARSWNLPDIVCDIILEHHNPDFLEKSNKSNRHKDLFGILKLTECILNKIKYERIHPESELMQESILGHFNLSEVDLFELEQDILEQYKNAYGLMWPFGDISSENKASTSLSNKNDDEMITLF